MYTFDAAKTPVEAATAYAIKVKDVCEAPAAEGATATPAASGAASLDLVLTWVTPEGELPVLAAAEGESDADWVALDGDQLRLKVLLLNTARENLADALS